MTTLDEVLSIIDSVITSEEFRNLNVGELIYSVSDLTYQKLIVESYENKGIELVDAWTASMDARVELGELIKTNNFLKG